MGPNLLYIGSRSHVHTRSHGSHFHTFARLCECAHVISGVHSLRDISHRTLTKNMVNIIRKKNSKRERIYLSLSGPTRLLTDFCILLVINFISQQSITRGVVNANRNSRVQLGHKSNWQREHSGRRLPARDDCKSSTMFNL